MNIGEAAGWAVALAKERGVAPAELETEELVRRLAGARVMISFFNDVDLGTDDPRVPAVSYFGTKGFFPGYDARADEPLDEGTADVWAAAFGKLRDGESADSMATARAAASRAGGDGMTDIAFAEMAGIDSGPGRNTVARGMITRGRACLMMYNALHV